jgi:hypothetical protein
MNLLRAGGHITLTGPAKSLHGRESQINNGTVRHRAVHHGPAADLVAGKPLLAVRTPRAGTLVKIEVDLGTDFLEVDSRNDIPLEGHQSLDISDFHTRLRPCPTRGCHLKNPENRHALTTKNHYFCSAETGEKTVLAKRDNIAEQLLCWVEAEEQAGALIPIIYPYLDNS